MIIFFRFCFLLICLICCCCCCCCFLQTGVRTLNHGTGLSSTLIIQNQFDLYKQIITFNIFNVRFLGYFLFCQAIFYNFQGSPFLNGRLKVIALYVFLKCGKSVLLHELMDIKRVLSVWTDIVSSRYLPNLLNKTLRKWIKFERSMI